MRRYTFHFVCALLTLGLIAQMFLGSPQVKAQNEQKIGLNATAFVWNKQHNKALPLTMRSPQTIVINKNGFLPNQLKFKQGETISLVIHNQDEKSHNFVLTDYHVFSRDLRKGETTTIKFTAVKKGNFIFFSDTSGFPETGYRGVFEVE
jgi:plastocyanin